METGRRGLSPWLFAVFFSLLRLCCIPLSPLFLFFLSLFFFLFWKRVSDSNIAAWRESDRTLHGCFAHLFLLLVEFSRLKFHSCFYWLIILFFFFCRVFFFFFFCKRKNCAGYRFKSRLMKLFKAYYQLIRSWRMEWNIEWSVIF